MIEFGKAERNREPCDKIWLDISLAYFENIFFNLFLFHLSLLPGVFAGSSLTISGY